MIEPNLAVAAALHDHHPQLVRSEGMTRQPTPGYANPQLRGHRSKHSLDPTQETQFDPNNSINPAPDPREPFSRAHHPQTTTKTQPTGRLTTHARSGMPTWAGVMGVGPGGFRTIGSWYLRGTPVEESLSSDVPGPIYFLLPT